MPRLTDKKRYPPKANKRDAWGTRMWMRGNVSLRRPRETVILVLLILSGLLLSGCPPPGWSHETRWSASTQHISSKTGPYHRQTVYEDELSRAEFRIWSDAWDRANISGEICPLGDDECVPHSKSMKLILSDLDSMTLSFPAVAVSPRKCGWFLCRTPCFDFGFNDWKQRMIGQHGFYVLRRTDVLKLLLNVSGSEATDKPIIYSFSPGATGQPPAHRARTGSLDGFIIDLAFTPGAAGYDLTFDVYFNPDDSAYFKDPSDYELTVDSVHIELLQVGSTLVPELTSSVKTESGGKYHYKDIVLPPDEDMIEIVCTPIMRNRSTGGLMSWGEFSCPLLIVPRRVLAEGGGKARRPDSARGY